ncbi:MAG: CHRD domain-containing protein, partial [Longimicrobiales bacterium]
MARDMWRALPWMFAGFVILAASPGNAAILTFEDVYLTGEQASSSSQATGLARITYDTTLKTLSIDVDVVGIRTSELNPVVAPDHPFHIHLAPPGQNGSIVLLLGGVG